MSPQTTFQGVVWGPVCANDFESKPSVPAGDGDRAEDPKAGRVWGEVVRIDPKAVVGQEHLTPYSNRFPFSFPIQSSVTFDVEELGLAAQSLFELLP